MPLPKIIGCDFSGTVVAIREKKEDEKSDEDFGFNVGDKVIGECLDRKTFNCIE